MYPFIKSVPATPPRNPIRRKVRIPAKRRSSFFVGDDHSRSIPTASPTRPATPIRWARSRRSRSGIPEPERLSPRVLDHHRLLLPLAVESPATERIDRGAEGAAGGELHGPLEELGVIGAGGSGIGPCPEVI